MQDESLCLPFLWKQAYTGADTVFRGSYPDWLAIEEYFARHSVMCTKDASRKLRLAVPDEARDAQDFTR